MGKNMSKQNIKPEDLKFIPRMNRNFHIEYTFNNRLKRLNVSKVSLVLHIFKQTLKWWVR